MAVGDDDDNDEEDHEDNCVYYDTEISRYL